MSATAHYEAFPYDVGVSDSPAYEDGRSPVGRFLAGYRPALMIDVGCGPGNLLPTLARAGGRVIGLDLSGRSLEIAAGRASGTGSVSLVRGNALRLPFRSDSVDAVVALGSLHHTGDARGGCRELMRVLRPGGSALVVLYRRGSYYEAAYRSIGRVARWAERRPVTRAMSRLVLLPLFGLYVIAGRALVHRIARPPSYRELLNYFADQLLNPVVSFHDTQEVREWVERSGGRVAETSNSHLGALINITIAAPQFEVVEIPPAPATVTDGRTVLSSDCRHGSTCRHRTTEGGGVE